jgi:hypothetical protein
MPELLVVHEFARRASTYAIPGHVQSFSTPQTCRKRRTLRAVIKVTYFMVGLKRDISGRYYST